MYKIKHIINYFYIFLSLIWVPFQVAILKIDGQGRMLFLLTILVLLINYIYDKRFRKLILTKPIVFWGIWIFYSTINLYVKGYVDDSLPFVFFIILSLVLPYLIMLLVTIEYIYDKEKLLKILVFTFLLYGIIDVFLLNDITKFSFTDVDRAWGKLYNSGPLNVIFLIVCSSLLFVQKKLNTYKLVAIVLFALLVIFVASTRKAFGAAIIVIVFTVLSQIKLSFKSIFIVVSILFTIYWGLNNLASKTTLGTRLSETTDQGELINNTNYMLLNLVGDRAGMYVSGWKLFINEPLTGIGLNNYINESKSQFVLHSEFMVQLTEGGIVGSIFFALFYWNIGTLLFRLWYIKKINKAVIWVLMGNFIAILFVSFTAWTYSFPQYFAALGLIIGNSKIYENWNTRFRRRII